MHRRNFIFQSAGAFVAASLGNVPKQISDSQNFAASRMISSKEDFVLNEVTINELQRKMSDGSLTSRTICELYLKRIEDIDRNGIKLNSIIELNPDALEIADRMDSERRSGKIRGSLHGIPILLKDNIDTADKMMTTAGALAMKGNIASKDSFIVMKLRESGAIILGKTNLSEWANFRSNKSTSGWSSRGGQTKNPCVLDRNPCGSSSGSAAAVAANLCTVAVGTETDGSVIAPSSFCGIVGIKPTVGLLSRSGIIPISRTQDTAGPMARTVTDAAILLAAMSGTDPDDEDTEPASGKMTADYTEFLDANGLSSKRIGIEKTFLEGNAHVVRLYNEAVMLMKNAGAEIVEIELLKQTSELSASEFTVLQYEFKDGLNKYLSHSNAPVRSLTDIIKFNMDNEDEAMPFFRQELLEACDKLSGLASKEYVEALNRSLSARKIIDGLLNSQKLDAIAGVSIGPACCIDLVNGDYDTGFYFCPPAAMAGYPHITIPMGKVFELPVGISFISGAWREGELIRIAYSYEQASRKRQAPEFLATAL